MVPLLNMCFNELVLVEGPYSISMNLLCGATLSGRYIYPVYCQHFVNANIMGTQFLRASPPYSFIKKQYFLPYLNLKRFRTLIVILFTLFFT